MLYPSSAELVSLGYIFGINFTSHLQLLLILIAEMLPTMIYFGVKYLTKADEKSYF